MSIFGSIVNKIFGHAASASGAGAGAGAPAGGSPGSVAQAGPAPAGFNNPTVAPSAPGSTDPVPPTPPAAAPSQPASPSAAPVDVTAVLDGLASKNAQKLDWRHSIVDLMKLLDLDSGLHARQELAKELHYSGSTDDSAAMNIWLHKQVMQKLAENGGKVPDDLK